MTLTKFVRTTAAAIGALAVATQVNAADIYAGGGMKDVPAYAPAPMWTGFYIGGHLGADWASIGTNRNLWNDGYGNAVYWAGDRLESVGAFGGVQLGYNWQSANFLFGLEVDLGGAANDAEHTFLARSANPLTGDTVAEGAFRVKTEGGFYGDVAGRLGYTWGPALLYAKGGFAWLDSSIKTAAIVDDGALHSFTHDANLTLTGWTVGGGLEYMLNPNWTMKVEYLYFDFTNANDTWNWNCNWTGATCSNSWNLGNHDLQINTVKLGFNYILNRGYAPLK